jgi:2-polyprenyl-3-methyl-5-hydroxy-6-metoxy-1,4-benzoquinol methylase
MAMDFSIVLDYIHEIEVVGDILEIGADRGDGSTFIFASIAAHMGRQLYSVDIDKDIIERNHTRFERMPFKLPVGFYTQAGEEFLAEHKDLKFSVVLLDNFDWQWNPSQPEDFIQAQVDRYKSEFAIDMSNLNSQITHLKQAILLEHMLTDQAVVLCDDTYWDEQHATYTGKCGAAIPFLMTLGFVPMLERDHGVILLRK